MEVEIISKELIKPSSLTPDPLRYLRLSFLDQWQAPIALPIVLFYKKSSKFSNTEMCNILKESFPDALTMFYPLAGRIKDKFYIHCNDEGALLVEARANCEMSTVLSERNAKISKNFIPLEPREAGDLASYFQITLFECGGLAISFALSHKLCDAASIFMFTKSWASIAKGNTNNIKAPQFGFSTLFPPISIPDFEQTLSEEMVTKLFPFSASAIASLKAKYLANYSEKLSSVEALSIFIWSRFMASTQSTKDHFKKKRYKVFQWVNLRPRMQLPESKIPFGNLITVVEAEATMDDKNDECYGIVKRMKDSVRNVNSNYTSKLQNNEENLKNLNKMGREDAVCFDFSSLCNLSIYESDFGWGKPIFLGVCPSAFENLVIFCDSNKGKGIDAWIGLKEEDMAKFEADNQLLALLSSTGFSRM